MSCAETAKAVQDLNATVRGMLPDAESRVAALEEVAKNKLYGIGTHVRLSKNAVLAPNADGTFPANWGGGYVYSAQVMEHVVSGVATGDRSDLAKEFLEAMKSNSQYFQSSFYIWRMKARIPAGATSAHLFYQRTNTSSGESTMGCVFKHVSGLVPDGQMMNGAKAAQPASVLLMRNSRWHSGKHHSYSVMHGYISGSAGQESEFLIALPAMVTGYVPGGDGWGDFPYLNQSEV